MNKLATVKLVARFVVGSGTTTVTNSIIRNNVSPSNMIETISVGVASVVIGSMASEATRKHTDAQIDALAELFQKQPVIEDPVIV
jgi:hypothetical protein